MKTKEEHDRTYRSRVHKPREMLVRPLPQLGAAKTSVAAVPARVQKIGEGTVCIVTSRPLERFAVLRCEISSGEDAINIPTLMQVRWTKKQKLQAESYVSELSFLL